METEQNFLIVPENGRVSAYFSKPDAAFINECYPIIMGSDEKKPVGEFMIKALQAAMAVSKPKSNNEDKHQIDALNKSILKINETLEVQNNQLLEKDSIIAQYKDNADSLEQTNTELANEIKNLRNQLLNADKLSIETNSEIENLKTKSVLPDNLISFEPTDFEHNLLTWIAKAEKERLSSNCSPELILRNLFAHIIKNGPHDFFRVPITIQKLKEIHDISNKI